MNAKYFLAEIAASDFGISDVQRTTLVPASTFPEIGGEVINQGLGFTQCSRDLGCHISPVLFYKLSGLWCVLAEPPGDEMFQTFFILIVDR